MNNPNCIYEKVTRNYTSCSTNKKDIVYFVAEHEKSPKLALLDVNGIKIFNAFDCSFAKTVFDAKQKTADDISKVLCQDPQKR